jgi:hypothetical protein
MQLNDLIFSLWDRQKNFVADRFASGIGSLASLHYLKSSFCHLPPGRATRPQACLKRALAVD